MFGRPLTVGSNGGHGHYGTVVLVDQLLLRILGGGVNSQVCGGRMAKARDEMRPLFEGLSYSTALRSKGCYHAPYLVFSRVEQLYAKSSNW